MREDSELGIVDNFGGGFINRIVPQSREGSTSCLKTLFPAILTCPFSLQLLGFINTLNIGEA